MSPWNERVPTQKEVPCPKPTPLSLTEICSCSHGQAKFHLEKSQARQRLSYLTTMAKGMFGGIKMRLSNLKTLNQLFSMAVVASRSGAVLIVVLLVHCTK